MRNYDNMKGTEGPCTATDYPENTVRGGIDRITQDIDRLECMTADLQHKLSPILTPSLTKGLNALPQETSGEDCCDIVRHIKTINHKVLDCIGRLEDICGQLQI